MGGLACGRADDRLIAVMDALTERDGEPEADCLARCAADPLALHIKRADALDKLEMSESGGFGVSVISDLRRTSSGST